ncbi:MAG: hypothetical protein LH479_00725 [Polaromonas sp.]|nr:hypothetical protein [Polaromonas sp.]
MTQKTPNWLARVLALSALLASTAYAQLPMPPRPPGLPNISGSLEGAISPGVYGRIEIGNSRPPPLIYAQPVIIQRPAVYVQQPLYLHVPPGHAKKWSKHCARYDACGREVYFFRVAGDDEYGRDSHKRYEYESRRHDKQTRRNDDSDYRGGRDDDGHRNNKGKGKKDHD